MVLAAIIVRDQLGWLVGRSVGWFVGWLVCRLDGRLVGFIYVMMMMITDFGSDNTRNIATAMAAVGIM